jgi:phasin family protein
MAKQDNNPFAEFFSNNDFTKAFEQYQTMPFDVKDLMEAQRRNIQAITEAQQLAMESLQTIAQRQTEILSQIVEDNSSLAKSLLSEGTPEEKMAKNADMFKKFYERTVSNMRELGDMVNKSNLAAGNVINKRVTASMNEIKDSLEKTQQKAA